MSAARSTKEAVPCPPRRDLEAFIHRELEGPAQRRIENHRRGCRHCQKVIAFLYRTLDLPFAQPMR